MEYSGSYAMVENILNEAKARFGNTYSINDSRYNDLEEICDIVDDLVEEFDCTFVEATVDEETMCLIISISCDEIILQRGRTHKFFVLGNLVDSFRFTKVKPDSLQIDFCIDGLLTSDG